MASLGHDLMSEAESLGRLRPPMPRPDDEAEMIVSCSVVVGMDQVQLSKLHPPAAESLQLNHPQR